MLRKKGKSRQFLRRSDFFLEVLGRSPTTHHVPSMHYAVTLHTEVGIKMATVGTTFRPKPLSLVIRGEKGRGSYGKVCRGELEGKPIMIKRIHEILLANSRSDQLRKFEQECQILETLHHPNIVRSLGAFWDDATKEPLLVMEPMRENLRDYLDGKKQAGDKLSVDDHLSISLSIAEGLKFLHEQKQPIAHRDLTDKNILLGEDGSIKIGDFGQSTLLAGSTDYMGTLAPGAFVFMPPEALMDEPHYNLKVDSFSMGVLMLEIGTQTHPPARMGKIGSSQEVERRSKDLILLDGCHPLKPLIIWCLQNQYQLRPDVATIHSQLMALVRDCLQMCTCLYVCLRTLVYTISAGCLVYIRY